MKNFLFFLFLCIEVRAYLSVLDRRLLKVVKEDFITDEVDTVRLLIKEGAKVDAKDAHEKTPLHWAAKNGHTAIAKLLIEKGAHVNESDAHGRTPLHWAAQNGHTAIARILIEKESHVNRVDNFQSTPLILAKENDRTDLVKWLEGVLRNRASVSASKLACMQYSKPIETSILIERILNGEPAEPGEFPWMAGLFYPRSDSLYLIHGCGGTIISEYFILTASHCVKENRRPAAVRVGKLTLNDNDGLYGKNYFIKNITKHPEYSMLKGKNDIALIETIDKIEFSHDVAAACLNTETKDIDFELIVTGWGATDLDNINNRSNWLQKTNLTTKPLLECNSTILDWNKVPNLLKFRNGISEGQYCAYDPEGKNDSCQGDSGGPLQYFHNSSSSTATIVGIVSIGYSCCSTLPGIYTRVGYYIDWIAPIVWPVEVNNNL